MPRTARALADGDLSRWMHWLLTAHVRRYQRYYHATGHVWQGRFNFSGMVQKRVTAQGWLGSTPEGQRPQIRVLRAGGSLAVARSIPATQLSSPARLAERVVTPHAPMTLGANHVSRAPDRG